MPAPRVVVPRGVVSAVTQPRPYFTRQAATARIVTSLGAFLQAQAALNRRWIAQHVQGRQLAGMSARQLQLVGFDAERESQLEAAFARNAIDRVSALLPKALDQPIRDRAGRRARWDALNAILEREGRFALMRQRELNRRLTSAVHRVEIMRTSPEGAYWRLGNAKEHTPDCVAMAGRFWPWVVLARVHPPTHPGCVCSLWSKARAIKAGWMGPSDVPDLQTAIKAAAAALPEGVTEALLEEWFDGDTMQVKDAAGDGKRSVIHC